MFDVIYLTAAICTIGAFALDVLRFAKEMKSNERKDDASNSKKR